MQVLRRPGERPQRIHNQPPPTPAQYRPIAPSATSLLPLISHSQPQPLPVAPPRAPPTSTLTLDSIRPLFLDGNYSTALTRYQQLRLALLSKPDSRSVEWLVDTARVWRMIGECQQKLEAWQDSSLSFSSALSLVDSAIDLPQLPRQWRYDVLILQQQLHHLMGDTHLALSEAMEDDDTAAAIELACEALQYGKKAEVEARELLDGVAIDEDEMEVKEALMGAGINIARAYTRLMSLTRQPSSPLPSSSSPPSSTSTPPSSTDYFRLAKRKLESSYKAAVTFALHQYQFLAYWNLAELQLADHNPLEALHYYSLLLTEVFRKCREDAVSKLIEWPVEQWAAEELCVQLTAGRLVRRIVDEGEVGDVEAVEWLRVGFRWLNAARLLVKSGGSGESGVAVVDVARKNEIAVLFNWMKAELSKREARETASTSGGHGGEAKVRPDLRQAAVSHHSGSSSNRAIVQVQQSKRRKLTDTTYIS